MYYELIKTFINTYYELVKTFKDCHIIQLFLEFVHSLVDFSQKKPTKTWIYLETTRLETTFKNCVTILQFV